VENNPAEGNHHEKDDPQHSGQFERLLGQEQDRGYDKDRVDPPADQEAKISNRVVAQNVRAIVSPGSDKCDFRTNVSPDYARAGLVSNSRQKKGSDVDHKPDTKEHPEERRRSFHGDSMAAVRIVSIPWFKLGSLGVLRVLGGKLCSFCGFTNKQGTSSTLDAYILVRERTMLTFLLWCILLVACWPLALLALVLYPLVWLLLLPFRILGIAVDGVLGLLKAVLFLPVRVLRGPSHS
jgi:hypothetical protein